MLQIAKRVVAMGTGGRRGKINTKKIRGKKKRVPIAPEARELRANGARKREFRVGDRWERRWKVRVGERGAPGGDKRSEDKAGSRAERGGVGGRRKRESIFR